MIRIGIYGYGNLGRGVESAIKQNDDLKLVAVFTRRDPASLKINTPGAEVVSAADVLSYKDKIDVMVLCGGSATDLPVQTPELAEHFNVIDSFDTHANIPEHYKAVNEKAAMSNHTAMISVGWDPGMFSLMRLYGNAILPDGQDYTFWGPGVSQGHSDAIRRIEGVLDARQYTIPVEKALQSVRDGEYPVLTTREKHTRDCYVVAAEGADKARIEKEIKEMPNYFSDYDTTVTFITAEEMKEKHAKLYHGGYVFRTGKTGLNMENGHVIEFILNLDSNPEFTSSVIASFARAVYRLHEKGEYGCKTVFDIPPILLINKDREDCIAHML